MPKDLGMLEDDMGSIQDKRGQLRRPMVGAGGGAPVPPVAGPRARPNPADAGIFTADKGIQPPSPDEGPTVTPKTPRQMKARKDLRAAMGMKSGGKVGSASKRADGCAQRGKTKGKML